MRSEEEVERIPAATQPSPVETSRTADVGTAGQVLTTRQLAWRRFKRHKLAMVSAVILLVLVLATAFVNWVSPYTDRQQDLTARLLSPNGSHFFGTDQLGRDEFTRVLKGGQISLLVGVAAALSAGVLGAVIGALAGYYGGWIDNLLMRVTDLFLSLPQLPVLLIIIYLFREQVNAFVLRLHLGRDAGIFILVVGVIGLLNWMSTARVVRASFLSIKQKEFVEAANCLGIKRGSIMFRHILPNVMSPIIVAATLEVGNAIILESVLSFLGLGFPPDTPTWGRLLYDGQNFLEIAPHLVLWPGLLIFLTVLAFNFLGDGLRDAADPYG